MISIGKLRRLQQCATERGTFAMLAIDHRQNLRRMWNLQSQGDVADAALIEFKQEIVRSLAPFASATLLDPEFGAAQSIATGALPGGCGLVVALEATGYDGTPTSRHSRILEGWSVRAACRMGASAVKLLVYYHPDSATAPEIQELVHTVASECATYDIPLFLEPLSYSLNPQNKKLTAEEHRRVVIETARQLTLLGIDILKAEFPVQASEGSDESVWQSACKELNAVSRVPWVLLSASVPYETFLNQVVVACRAGAAGVAVGRAVWQEAVTLARTERITFLNSQARERMRRMRLLCDALARPFTEFYSLPVPEASWYRTYNALTTEPKESASN